MKKMVKRFFLFLPDSILQFLIIAMLFSYDKYLIEVGSSVENKIAFFAFIIVGVVCSLIHNRVLFSLLDSSRKTADDIKIESPA